MTNFYLLFILMDQLKIESKITVIWRENPPNVK